MDMKYTIETKGIFLSLRCPLGHLLVILYHIFNGDSQVQQPGFHKTILIRGSNPERWTSGSFHQEIPLGASGSCPTSWHLHNKKRCWPGGGRPGVSDEGRRPQISVPTTGQTTQQKLSPTPPTRLEILSKLMTVKSPWESVPIWRESNVKKTTEFEKDTGKLSFNRISIHLAGQRSYLILCWS